MVFIFDFGGEGAAPGWVQLAEACFPYPETPLSKESLSTLENFHAAIIHLKNIFNTS